MAMLNAQNHAYQKSKFSLFYNYTRYVGRIDPRLVLVAYTIRPILSIFMLQLMITISE